MMTIKPMSRRLEVKLIKAWQTKGDKKARERLVKHHQGIVFHLIGKRFGNRSQQDREEMIGEAQVGLLEAIDRFDPSRGTRLVSYVGLWFNVMTWSAILRDAGPYRLARNGPIREVFWGLNKAENQLRAAGIEPTVETIAVHLGVEEHYVLAVMEHRASTKSLDAPAGEDTKETVGSAYAEFADRGDSPETGLERAEWEYKRSRALYRAMGKLNEKQRDVLLRYDLSDDDSETLEGIGKKWGLSRERIRQIRLQAIEKIKHGVPCALR